MKKYTLEMFDSATIYDRLGSDLNFNDNLLRFKEVEKYFVDLCNTKNIECSYDCIAMENLYFKTLNYTTYAGMFIINPLQPELSMKQIYDAMQDKTSNKLDYFDYFKSKTVDLYNLNKYRIEDEGCDYCYDYNALVVLPGHNKFNNHVSINKIKWIIRQHGEKVLFKPHPITYDDFIDELRNKINKKNFIIVDKKSNLYSYMHKAEIVYTTHLSESALYSRILNKPIYPIDKCESRIVGSFTHINYHLFLEDDVRNWINTVFSSYKSGIISLDVDGNNWRQKIDNYVDYILSVRDKFKYAYL